MKKLYILLIGLFLSITGSSQSCLPEGIIFTVQAQIDSFQVNYPGCTEIEGNVTIQGDDITDLNGLSVLTSIEGDLIIAPDNYGNPLLTSLTGLESLTSIGGNLKIEYNRTLTNLTGLEGLTYISENITIQGNEDLTSLTGLDNLISIDGYLEIFDNDALSSLSGLESLTTIGNDLILWNNYNLISLTGFNNLTSIGGELQIENNSLTDLTGLSNLNHIGGILDIEFNHLLNSLAGLDNIDPASIERLNITYNTALYDCNVQSICEYVASPNGAVNIHSNAPGCDSHSEVANACGIEIPCLPYGNYYFHSQAEIDNFQINYPDCQELNGYLEIQGSDINNLSGLSTVTSIGGNLFINSNEYLTSLTGLDNLTSVGGNLNIGYWEGLYNLSLISLNGLENLNFIGGNLDIIKNPVLISLTGLNNLTNIGGSISVILNDSLTSLSGLDNIDAASINNLQIGSNSSLSTCEVKSICDYLASPNGNIDINSNAPGCNTQAEVKAACGVGLDENNLAEDQFTISPNPSSTRITIETSALPSKFQFSIFNHNGQELIRRQITEPRTVIEISDLLGGVYFVRLTGERTVSVEKFVKID